MLACAAEISSPCRASVALGILVSSLHSTWDSVRLQSDVEATRKSLRKTWARTSTLILPSRILQHHFNVCAGPKQFSPQPPVAKLCRHLFPLSPSVDTSPCCQ